MSHAVPAPRASSGLSGHLAILCLGLAAMQAHGAIGQSGLRPGFLADEGAFQAATRQQHQFAGDADAARCEPGAINEAVALIYQYDDSAGASALARRCEVLAVSRGRPDYRTLASRIQALVAIKAKDMPALQSAGESLVAQGQTPEYIADGHLFIAFACTFSGHAVCARTHLEQAKAMFTRHEVAGALEQLMSVEQALLKLEASSTP